VTSKDDGDDAKGSHAMVPVMGPSSARRHLREVKSRVHGAMERLRKAVHGPWQREQQRIRATLRAQGLFPLLMKGRNGAGWTRDERIQIWHYLRQMASLSPYLIALLAPGSVVLLPVVAWWLDRRRMVRGFTRLDTASTQPPVT
jgi:hypothetical protein